MKTALFVALAAAAFHTSASNTIDIRSERPLIHPDRVAWEERRYPDLLHRIAAAAQSKCPAGFEKVSEYAAPEGPASDWYLHFVVRCITPPATPVASTPGESK